MSGREIAPSAVHVMAVAAATTHLWAGLKALFIAYYCPTMISSSGPPTIGTLAMASLMNDPSLSVRW